MVSVVDKLKAKSPALIAEIMLASPSKDPIVLTANAAQQAPTYALTGASVISILTEPTWSKGSLLDMRCAPALYPDAAATTTTTTTGMRNVPWFVSHAHLVATTPLVRPLVVGVFQGQPLACELHCPAAAQLHGPEPVGWAMLIPVSVIYMFHIDTAGDGVEGIARPGLCRHVLLDAATATSGLSYGRDLQIDWGVARKIVESGKVGDSVQPTRSGPLSIILTRGFGPGNVAGVVHDVRP